MKFPEQYRCPMPGNFQSSEGDRFGAFVLPDGGDRLICMVDDGCNPDMPADLDRWEHVSVTVRNKRGVQLQRCPTWEQMSRVKAAFWDATDTVVQFHPPESEYVNTHPYCLHLWRKVDAPMPTPPKIFV